MASHPNPTEAVAVAVAVAIPAPVSGATLFRREIERRDKIRRKGVIPTGCPEIDDILLLGGGFDRGCVVGVSAEAVDFGVLLGLQTIARALVLGEFPNGNQNPVSGQQRVAIITTLPVTAILPKLRDVVRSQVQQSTLHPNKNAASTNTTLRRALEAISISRIFDLEGLWEVLGELGEPISAGSSDRNEGEDEGISTSRHAEGDRGNGVKLEAEGGAISLMEEKEEDRTVETKIGEEEDEEVTNPGISEASPEPLAASAVTLSPREPITQLPPLRIGPELRQPSVRRFEVLDSEDEEPLSSLSSSPLSSPPPSSMVAAPEPPSPPFQEHAAPSSSLSPPPSSSPPPSPPAEMEPGNNTNPNIASSGESHNRPELTTQPPQIPDIPPSPLTPVNEDHQLQYNKQQHQQQNQQEQQRHQQQQQPAPTVTPPDIILITHFTSLLTARFTQTDNKATAHADLHRLATRLRALARPPESAAVGPLIMLLNTTTTTTTSSEPPPKSTPTTGQSHQTQQPQLHEDQQQQQQQQRQKPSDATLRSIFSPSSSSGPGIGIGMAVSRPRPSFGGVFAQLLDLHLLCTRVPRTADDVAALAALQGQGLEDGVRFAWVVEALLDDFNADVGSRSREQRWAAVEVGKDGGRILDAFRRRE